MLTNALLFAALTLGAETSTLAGTVMDDEAKPLKDAIVTVYDAKPQAGVGSQHPADYADCGKSARTAADRSFQIEMLDSSLLFRVMVSFPGKRSVLSNYHDPDVDPLKVKLLSWPAKPNPGHILRGRVLDSDGEPIVGARVAPTWAKTTRRTWGGRMPGVDQQVVTDANGRFVLLSQESKLAMKVEVRARHYAPVNTQEWLDLAPEGKQPTEHTIKMNRGVSVIGRILHEGRPVAGRVMGVVQVSRSSRGFVGPTVLATDDDGVFRFDHLLADEQLAVYAKWADTDTALTTKTMKFQTGEHGSTTQLGDIPLVQGHILAGRVVTPQQAPVPGLSRLTISRITAWDYQDVTVNTDGSFVVHGLPPEVYSIRVRVPGFDVDTNRFRYQMLRDKTFGLSMKRDRTGFEIPLRLE